MEEVKGPVVAGRPGRADDRESRLGLEVLVRPGGEKSGSSQGRGSSYCSRDFIGQRLCSRVRLGMRRSLCGKSTPACASSAS